MKVKDLIREDIDIDVCDDYTEELYIAFCGPMEMTEEGAEHFATALELEVEFFAGGASVHVEDDEELHEAVKFFHAAAGYCAADDYDLWFKEDNA